MHASSKLYNSYVNQMEGLSQCVGDVQAGIIVGATMTHKGQAFVARFERTDQNRSAFGQHLFPPLLQSRGIHNRRSDESVEGEVGL